MAKLVLVPNNTKGLICDGIFDTVAEVQEIAKHRTSPTYISFDQFGLVKLLIEVF